MLSLTAQYIVIAIAACAVVFAVGALTIVAFLRHKHQRIIRRHGLDLDPPQYMERSRVMSDWDQEASSPQGREHRRSLQLPYGFSTSGWNTLSAHDRASPNNSVVMFDQNTSPTPEEPLQPMRKASRKMGFSTHSFSIPKTRRQKKIEKTIPLGQIPRSPLSAITERSGSNTDTPSPAVGSADRSVIITPKSTPDKENLGITEKLTSIAWPIPIARRTPQKKWKSPGKQSKGLLHMSTSDHSLPQPKQNLGPRSNSEHSQLSSAPEDPLPPLPTFSANKLLSPKDTASSRYSNITSETAGTSVLNTPVVRDTNVGPNPKEPSSPHLSISQTGLEAYDPESDQWEPSTLSIGTPPAKRINESTRRANVELGSTYGSIRSNSHTKPTTTSAIEANQESNEPQQVDNTESNLTTVDASQWNLSPRRRLSNRRNSRRQNAVKSPVQRRSVASDAESSPTSMMDSPPFTETLRPSSTGLSEGRTPSARSSISSIGSSSGSQKKGHKRQNCIRISNLPPVDISRRPSKPRLPLMTEEDEQENKTPPVTPGLSLDKLVKLPSLGILNIHHDLDPTKPKSSPLALTSRPVLEPTTRRRPILMRSDTDDSETSDVRSESDIFSSDSHQYPKPHDNGAKVFLRQDSQQDYHQVASKNGWPQPAGRERLAEDHHQQSSQQTHEMDPNGPSTPGYLITTLKNEPFDDNSPTLPSPPSLSTNLFARRFHGRYPKKSAGGPNGPRAQALAPDPSESAGSSRDTSPTPNRMSNTTKATSLSLSADYQGQDLRKSAMMLRRMNSEMRNHKCLGKSYQSYRNLGDTGTAGSTPSQPDINLSEYMRNRANTEMKSPTANTLANVRLQMKSPSTVDIHSLPTGEPRKDMNLRVERTSGVLNTSRNRLNVQGLGLSPSTASMGGQSDMWEDASVKSDIDEPGPAIMEPRTPPEKENMVLERGFESFAGACQVIEPPESEGSTKTPREKKRQGGLLIDPSHDNKSPSFGLGLMGIGLSAWGTPPSLYDKDGFLRE